MVRYSVVLFDSSQRPLVTFGGNPPLSTGVRSRGLCSIQQPLLWSDSTQGHMKAVVIVGPGLSGGEILNLLNTGPVILGKPLVANRPVESFHLGIFLGVAKVNIVTPDSHVLGPALNHCTDVFRAVVTAYRDWLAPPGNDLLECPDDPFGRE